MNGPQRIQLRRTAGWRMPAGAVKVDRSTRWGNPFVVGVHGTRAECVAAFEQLLAGEPVVGSGPSANEQQACLEHACAHLAELRGKDLACWCPTDQACHADVLLRLANAEAAR
jgi:hypothetical protein